MNRLDGGLTREGLLTAGCSGVWASFVRDPGRSAALPLFCSAVSGHHGGMTAEAHEYHGYVGVQRRGVISLPAELRKRLHLDEPGAQLELTERSDGVIELRPALPVPADQKWFWTQAWQEREQEVDAHVAVGEVAVHDSGEDFLAHLDDLRPAE